MKSYKESSFQDRIGRAADAKAKALEQLRSRPPIDPEVLAERKAASLRRDAAKAEKAAARKAAKQAATDAATAEAMAKSSAPPALTEAELKARRDARYAARKSRK